MASLTPPPGINLEADQRQRVVNSGIALIILPTCFVILRFVSRSIANAGFWWDDLLVVISLFLSYGPNMAMMICGYHSMGSPSAVQFGGCTELMNATAARKDGFGRHLWALPDPQYNTSQFLKILYIYIIFYYSAVATVKLCM